MTVKNDARSKDLFGDSTVDENIVIEVDLHEAQLSIYHNPARFRVAACGRRFGKTVLGAVECLIEAIDNPGAMVWWVAPTNKQTRLAKRQLTKMLPRNFFHVNNTYGEFTLANGSHIFLRSAERFDNLRGEGVDFMVIDEAAFIDEEAWTDALRPTLSDRGGRALFISTFKGENWFWKLWTFAENPANDDWAAFTFPTAANPYIPEDEIDAARRSMPRDKFLQEYEASAMSFVGAVFDGELVAAAAERGKQQFETTRPKYVEAGLDWGWHFTALEVCHEGTDDRITWVYEHVFEHVELNRRCEEIARVCRDMGVEVVYTDAAGATENATLARTFYEKGVRCDVQPVPFNIFKDPGINTRRYYLENNLEDISPRCDQLVIDSKRYHWDPTGEKPAKGDDHTVDACTAFYASRADVLMEIRQRNTEEDAA